MWKLVSALRILSQRSRSHTAHISLGKRYFLSEAFQLRNVWEKRLQAPVLQNINLDELFHALDQKFNRDGKASAIDIDLFANAVRNESYIDELEDLIHKLRLSVNTTKTLPSTHHAVVRYFMDIGQYESLIRILNDRLNYGMFPDHYSLCLLLDTFIKKKQISEAARVSSIHMLQEDWNNPLVTALALYACHEYVQNPAPWESEVEEDDGEEVKVRVHYVRNPYFDDHFDLREPQLLVGKTLAAVGATMPDAVGQTYRLVGLGLHRKWEKAISLLEQLPNTGVKPGIYSAGLKVFEETFKKELNDENDPESKLRENLRRLVKELETKGLVTNDDLHDAVVSKVEQIVAREEKNMISTQEALYGEWEKMREKVLKEEMEELKRQQRLALVEQEKQQLIQKEKELFFFDNEDKIDMLLEKQGLQEEVEKKLRGKTSKDPEVDYIPPEISRSRN
ncbi:28S ribosomal protein S27, mitochondrial [Gryllus bimaculatus]|nr:28S ribosomal protein S27, mitochondrial [Gryllus bimaculatus]